MNNFDAIPNELKQYKNWVLWRLENIGSVKPTKIPYSTFGNPASVTNPNDWSTFDNVVHCYNQGSYSGIGFVFSDNDPFSGIDLDDAEGDVIIYERQLKVFKEFNSYSELSPSGKGLHIIVKGKVASGRRKSKIEIYSSKRYFTMTGSIYQNNEIAEANDLLHQLWEQIGGEERIFANISNEPQSKEDVEIIKIASEALNKDKFLELYSGDWKKVFPEIAALNRGPSEADQALMNMIIFYTKNIEQAKRIFYGSVLGKRDKVKRKDYISNLIKNAFDKSEAQINIDEYAKQLELQLAASSNGKTAPFEGVNLGSNPSATSNGPVAQRSEPIAHNGLVVGSNPTGTTIALPPGLVGDIAKFIYQAAPRPVKEVAIAASLGLMAGICGRAYNISGTGLNQYIMLIAMTGAGKEAMASGIDRIINAVQLSVPVASEFIGPSRIASGQALYKYLANKSQSFVSIIGEFGKRLEAMSGRNANSAEKQLIAELLDLYNKSGFGQTAKPSIYSDQDKNTLTIQSPAFSILGESTPDTFYGSLNEDMISDGLLPRFMLIEYNGPRPELNENHINVQPDFTLIDTLSTLMANAKTVMAGRKVINIDRSEEAAKMLQEFDRLADSKINSTDKEVIRQLWNRAHIKVLKIAALIAVGQNIYNPIVSIENVLWAKRIVENDIKALSIKFEEGVVGKSSEEIKQVNEAKRMLKEFIQPNNWDKISKYCLDQRFYSCGIIPYHYLNKRLSALACYQHDKSGATTALKRAIQTLIDSGIIVEASKQDLIKRFDTGQKAYAITNIKMFL